MSFPFFLAALDLTDKPCVVFGGDQEAVARASALLAHGARVRVVAPQPSISLSLWLEATPQVSFSQREPVAADLDQVWLAIQTERNPTWARALGAAAAQARVWFCAVDQPDSNSFAHVGIARAGALQLGVSTSGTVPGVAGAIRRCLQKLLDESQFEQVIDRIAEARQGAAPAERSAIVRALAAQIDIEGRLLFDDALALAAADQAEPGPPISQRRPSRPVE